MSLITFDLRLSARRYHTCQPLRLMIVLCVASKSGRRGCTAIQLPPPQAADEADGMRHAPPISQADDMPYFPR